MFGIPRDGSLYIASFGAISILLGVALLLFTSRHAFHGKPSLPLLLVVALAVALHAYEAFLKGSGGPSMGFFLWPLTPYALCLFVAAFSTSATPSTAGATIALLFDLVAYDSVFLN